MRGGIRWMYSPGSPQKHQYPLCDQMFRVVSTVMAQSIRLIRLIVFFMTRSELILALAQRFPQLQVKDVDISVKEILDQIGETLVNGHRVEIRGFGTFSLNYRPPRIGRNPKTGVKVSVPAKYTPHFKAGKELRERVDLSA